MADPASKFTDEELKKVEKQLKSVYSQAYLDILQKQDEFNRKYEEKSKKYLEKVAKGEMTQAQYSDWLKGQVFQGDQWQAKKEQMINVIYNSNKTATDILNGKTKSVFAFNATYANYNLEHGAGVNFGFGIYDTNTVINLVKNNPKLLPEWKIDQAKDYRWSQKKLNKQVSLGIIEGESLDKIATRLCNNLCTTNFNKMRTFARTSMTGAQNEGRLFSYENAKELNIKVKKQWMCTLDDHTRITHQQLDGQTQETDKPFEVDGLKIMYPGDPNAEPALVFNCRCTMVADIEDYPATYDRYDNIDGRPIKQMTYEEWLDAKSKGSDILPVPLTFSHTEQMAAEIKHTIIQGQDISTTWKRRPGQFDFEIEDVVNAQGFDGLPRTASGEKFNEYVKESNMITNRGYTAPDQESVDKFHGDLIKGKWYLECSGGSMNGYGMYTAGNYGTELLGPALRTSSSYSNGQFGKVEVMTLDKSAKIIKTDEIYNLKREETANYFFSKINEEGIELSPVQTEMARMRCGVDVGSIWERYSPNEMKEANNSLKKYYEKYLDDAFEYYGKFQYMDQGVYAALKGYDAMEVNVGGDSKHFIILNRTKLIIREP